MPILCTRTKYRGYCVYVYCAVINSMVQFCTIAQKSKTELTESQSRAVSLQEQQSVIFGCSRPRCQDRSMLTGTAEVHQLIPCHSSLSSPTVGSVLHPPSSISTTLLEASKHLLSNHSANYTHPSPPPASKLDHHYYSVNFTTVPGIWCPSIWCCLQKIVN